MIEISEHIIYSINSKRLVATVGYKGFHCLIKLWSYVETQNVSGVISGLCGADIEEICDWDGELGALFDAFCNCGFIAVEENVIRLTCFQERKEISSGAEV